MASVETNKRLRTMARKSILTASGQKKRKMERLKALAKSRVYLTDQHDRWDNLKIDLGLSKAVKLQR
jgi:hypothetical protein